jgi:hypothetical protein
LRAEGAFEEVGRSAKERFVDVELLLCRADIDDDSLATEMPMTLSVISISLLRRIPGELTAQGTPEW